jgi:GTP pyrophosphokinase
MHKIAEYGIAAHWSYKETGSRTPADDSRIAWLRGLLDNSAGASPREFLDSLKVDLYPDEVYSFTPRGDVFSFPRGATILDFAYRVHSEVGHSCVGGRVNGRWVPLKTEIKNGDIVEITTSSQQRPHHDWLSIVVTTRARSKIRAWLKREEKARAVEVGRKLLERELRKSGATLRKVMGTETMEHLLTSHGFAREDDLLAALGFGKLAAPAAAAQLLPTTEQGGKAPAPAPAPPPSTQGDSAILEVTGDADFLVYIAKCCTPLPGEHIVGYITRGKGVAVHSRSCPNVKNLLYHPEREIDVQWASSAGSGESSPSRVDVEMMFQNRADMLEMISHTVSAEGSKILSCQLRTEHDETGFAAITIAVRDGPQFTRILSRLQNLQGMLQVERRGVVAH